MTFLILGRVGVPYIFLGHKDTNKYSTIVRHFRLKVPHAGKTITPINLRFEAYFPKFDVSLCQLR